MVKKVVNLIKFEISNIEKASQCEIKLFLNNRFQSPRLILQSDSFKPILIYCNRSFMVRFLSFLFHHWNDKNQQSDLKYSNLSLCFIPRKSIQKYSRRLPFPAPMHFFAFEMQSDPLVRALQTVHYSGSFNGIPCSSRSPPKKPPARATTAIYIPAPG